MKHTKLRQICQSRTLCFAGLLAAVFILFLAGVYVLVSNAQKQRSHEQWFTETFQLHHKINENVLSTIIGMSTNYDELAKQTNLLLSGCVHLQKKSMPTSLKADWRRAVSDYCDAVQNKAIDLEEFKSQHSRLQNSISYLPTVVEEIRNLQRRRLALVVFNAILVHQITSTNESRQYAEKQVKDFKASTKTTSEFLMHANLALHALTERKAAKKEILHRDLDATLASVKLVHTQARSHYERISVITQLALMTVCLVLGIIAFNMFENTRRLSMQLEEKVLHRTQQLQTALHELGVKQEMLVQSTKFSALGEMAGGIAHEINTPLGAILLNAEFIQSIGQALNNKKILERSEKIVTIVQKISKIIMGLRNFSRSNTITEKQATLVESIVNDTLVLCSEKLRIHGIQLEVDIQDPTLEIWCVPEQISQVLLNLLNNSYDALKDLRDQEKWILLKVAKNDDGHAEISVTDSGAGLSKEAQQKVMQPFFTTKPAGKGTGLGLSISKGIIEGHGGKIYYDANCNHTCFVMTLPKNKAEQTEHDDLFRTAA